MTSEVARIFALLPRSGKPSWRRRRLPLPLAARTAAEGIIGAFSFAFGRSPPVGCLDRMTIERLTPTRAEAAAAVRRSAAKSPGTFAAGWPPSHLEGNVASVADDLRAARRARPGGSCSLR